MRNIFVISDTHFGHKNILNFLNEDGSRVRDFSSVEEMDELIVENWNKTVKDDDIVYHLGDVYFGAGHQHLKRLRGRKRLILGNHDEGKNVMFQGIFQKILVWRLFPEFNCVLSHVPVHESALYKVKYNLHGHVHTGSHRGLIEDPRYVNCCVEVRNYTPTPIEELIPNVVR
jgi:calcineurin-like phosphoesterase family protein